MDSPPSRRRALSTSSSSSSLTLPSINPASTTNSLSHFLVVPNLAYGMPSMPHQPHHHQYRQKSAGATQLPRPTFATPTHITMVKPPPIVSVPFQTPTYKKQPNSAQSAASAATMTKLTTLATTPAQYTPPQHKHAHHLHSIPPREKNTRTLILDHMLWQHSKARFDQASAELADVDVDAQGAGDEVTKRDVVAAKTLKARADGLEKVLLAMLDQPEEEVPPWAWDADDLLADSSSSSSLLPNGIRIRIALARLINDLYAQDADLPPSASVAPAPYLPAPPAFASLTPALLSLSRISSFATYQKETALPKLPSFHTFTATAGLAGGGASAPPAHSLLPPPGSIFSTIPRGAGPESAWALGRGSNGSTTSNPHPPTRDLYSNNTASSSGSGLMPPPAPPRVFRAVGRAKDLYNGGVNVYLTQQQSSSDMAPTIRLRCPHHLTFTCPPSSFCSHVPPSTALDDEEQTQAQAQAKRVRSNIGSGLGGSRAKNYHPLRGKSDAIGSGGTGASMTELIPRFLRLSACVAVELGREAREVALMEAAAGKKDGLGSGADAEEEEEEEEEEVSPSSAASSRFAATAGKGKAKAKTSAGAGRSSTSTAALPTREWYNLLVSFLTRATLQGYLQKGWRGTDPVEILLGVGVGHGKTPPIDLDELAMEEDEEDALGARDEGMRDGEFRPDEWPGLADAWGVLFGSGWDWRKHHQMQLQGQGREDGRYSHGPGAGGSSRVPKRAAYAEFERTMADRITDFLTLPHHDLATYLDFFSRVKYKQESADKEALRFFEAVANWRGEPELEVLRKNSAKAKAKVGVTAAPGQETTNGEATASTSPNEAESEQAKTSRPSSPSTSTSSAPPAPPSIFTYFTLPPPSVLLGTPTSTTITSPSTNKRKDRSSETSGSGDDEGGKPSAKKAAVAVGGGVPAWGHGRAWMEPDEYVGPYGI